MIIALVKLLKSILNTGTEYLTVDQEIENLKNYVLIYQNRYANFSIEYQISGSTYNCLVPKLIVQPLVENSIVHGGGTPEFPIHISVRAFLEGERLILEVADNGAGIPPEVRKKLWDSKGRFLSGADSVGLRNISDRVTANFGHSYGLRLLTADGGTAIRISIPAKWTPDEGALL